MARQIREPLWLEGDPGLSDDPLLETAYAVSEGIITFIGPIFWICLVYLFLVAEFTG
jgi:hypothetical protein